MSKIFKKTFQKIRLVNKVLLAFLVASIISIVVMDLFLKRIEAPYEIMYTLGVVYYNVCLSYCASFVFYIITIYIPQERKKLSTYRYLHNKISTIYEIEQSFFGLFGESISNKEDLESACLNINPHENAKLNSMMGNINFTNWFQLIDFISKKIKSEIEDILVFNDCLSMEVVMILTNIEDIFSLHLNRTQGNVIGNRDMQFFHSSIWDLHVETKELMKTFRLDSSQIVNDYNEMYRKRRKSNS